MDEQQKISYFVTIEEDITEEKMLSEMLHHQASHDSLTGLLNRRECEKRLSQIYTVFIYKNLCTYFVFWNHFKIINDSCGHRAGW